ncbi:alpha/beta hydrolase [Granulicella sibirica]|uniref:Putative signal peptide protein n=1 Tax=Granulicella sibirica TaxID=2479048 RepID=A0A4Q0SW83_9BACT|nr:alpha/beta hydrolase [Granulicella sibirica]RXH55375.1 putative signal peptide protein [Granulicella sibirica]
MKNVVLVHGAWVDGSSWSKVIPLLEAKGLHVVSVQIPLSSLADDVAATSRALALIDGPAILVGHSYGGVVITQAGNDPKVKGLVYIAAFAPDAGESVLGLTKTSPVPSPAVAQIQPDSNGFTKITKQGIYEDFAEELSESEKEVLLATQGPTSGPNALGAPVTEVAWKTKPSWTLITLKDRVIPFQAQQFMAQRSNAQVSSVPASHLVILAHPKEVAEVIERAANGGK